MVNNPCSNYSNITSVILGAIRKNTNINIFFFCKQFWTQTIKSRFMVFVWFISVKSEENQFTKKGRKESGD